MRFDKERFGARLGVGLCFLGFVVIFIAWNGAASVDRITSQFPYLISGGIGGLGLIVVGAALIVVETSREERDALRSELSELRAAIAPPPEEPVTNGKGPFVRGATSYHRPSCRLLEGRGDLPRVDSDDVARHRLVACRVCEPAKSASARAARPGAR
jgi:hypothetical protein